MPCKFKEKECEMCEVSYTPNSSRQRYCKECVVKHRKQYDKQYYQENKEQIKQKKKKYYQRPENKEKKKQHDKQYQKQRYQRQEIKEQKKQYYQENKEQKKQYYQKNKEQDTACLYLISNISNGHIYIGETVAFARRIERHKTDLKAGRHPNSLLQKDYNKHGPEAFEFAIIKEINKEDFQTEEQLKEHLRMEEAKMILKEVDEGKELYNISLNPEYVVQVLRERLLE